MDIEPAKELLCTLVISYAGKMERNGLGAKLER